MFYRKMSENVRKNPEKSGNVIDGAFEQQGRFKENGNEKKKDRIRKRELNFLVVSIENNILRVVAARPLT